MDLTKLSEIETLALTIDGEARGEPIEGQVAVGSTIRDRVVRPKNYNDICLAPEQFSCWNKSDPNYVRLTEMANKLLMGQQIVDQDYQQCLWVATGIYNWVIKSNVGNSKFYMVTTLFNSLNRPSWASLPKNVKQIGKQTFFEV